MTSKGVLETRKKKQHRQRSSRCRPLLREKLPASDNYEEGPIAFENTKKRDNRSKTTGHCSDLDYDSDYRPKSSSKQRFCCIPITKGRLTRRLRVVAPPSHALSDDKSPLQRCHNDSSNNSSKNYFEEMVPPSLPKCTVGVKYSLRSAIGDGGSKQAEGPSVMERRDLHPNGCHLKVSHWSEEGMRGYMEDRYAIEELGSVLTSDEISNKTSSLPLCYLGLFDGHGGDKASQYCCDQLSAYIRHQVAFPTDLAAAMESAYQLIDRDFTKSGFTDGSTACCCIVVGGERIVCANAGDSRAIVVRRDGTVVPLSRDHKPGVPSETKRITDLGGKVVYWGQWRVESVLAVSRSVGDVTLKPYITADPELRQHQIQNQDLFLVMATDGIWDALDNQTIAHLLLTNQECITMEEGTHQSRIQTFKNLAKLICLKASQCGSTDNKTAIIVDLQSYKQFEIFTR